MIPAVKKAIQAMTAKIPAEPKLTNRDYLSTGVTLIDLSLRGSSGGGIRKGRVYRLNGRPSGGKTFVGRTILAEAAQSKWFQDYELIYDDVERGALMDTQKFFGQKLVDRLRAPGYTNKGRAIYSTNTDDFYNRVSKKLSTGKRIIWIEDSLDALEGIGENKMTDNKAKIHSQRLRRLMDPLEETGSILVLVSQARANVGASMFEDEDITAGGRALEHYPSADIRLRKAKAIRKTLNKTKYSIGSIIRANVSKNRISGKNHTVYFPFFPEYGIDDIGANINYLQANKHWKTGKTDDDDDEDDGTDNKAITAPEFKFEGPKDRLIIKIETEGLQKELQILTAKVWKEIEIALQPQRLPRYS